jgi:hypothetical protein
MNAAGTRLAAITRQLMLQWQQTREYWTDAKSLEFEQKYLQELFATVERTTGVIEQLDKLIGRIKKDCE